MHLPFVKKGAPSSAKVWSFTYLSSEVTLGSHECTSSNKWKTMSLPNPNTTSTQDTSYQLHTSFLGNNLTNILANNMFRATNTPMPLMNTGSSPAAHAPTASGNLVSHSKVFLSLLPGTPFLRATREIFPHLSPKFPPSNEKKGDEHSIMCGIAAFCKFRNLHVGTLVPWYIVRENLTVAVDMEGGNFSPPSIRALALGNRCHPGTDKVCALF
ncbi:hypothetical protein K449DRAFT_384387 [Hypoxylon sp. EC38]|nr:hypothetical protein K449DRAFT_384387 [Hypoxylon sp. EC38]